MLKITSVIIAYSILLIIVHCRGFISGFKNSYVKGYTKINDPTLKTNHAQGEVIHELIEKTKNKPP